MTEEANTAPTENREEKPYHALKTIPDIDQKILEAIGTGKSLRTIAEEYGVSDVAILQRARKHPEYRNQLEVGLEFRMDDRERELEAAKDNVSVTRADRLLNHARWLAERRLPHLFGQKQEVTHQSPVQINIGISRDGAAQPVQRNTDHNVIDVAITPK
jgi:hypothetical protein